MKKKILVLTGGGTAGHVYPCIAIKETLGDEFECHYIGTDGMEKKIVEREKDITYHTIDAVKFRRSLSAKNLLIPFKLLSSICQAKKILKELSPCVVFSKGGYVALPVVIAARQLKIKVVSHESDLSMGLANKIIYKFCDQMCTAFEKTAEGKSKCICTGQPIRKAVLDGDKNRLTFLNQLDKNKKNILVVGGSSGAKFINDAVVKNIVELTKLGNVIHLTGRQGCKKIARKNYVQIDYANNMGDLIDLADVIISRAGSGAINEFLALGKPMLLIPLSKKASRGDQIENAKLFSSLGYADMLKEEDFTDELFIVKISNLIKNDKKIAKNMKKTAKNAANLKIATIIRKYLANN